MAHARLLLLLAAAAVWAAGADAAVLNIVHSLIRNNLAGTPDNFETQRFELDPQAPYHWRREYRQLNGIRGEALIERLGLGIDGRDAERRAQQAARDSAVYISRQPERGP